MEAVINMVLLTLLVVVTLGVVRLREELVRRDPLAHLRIFFKDLAHLFRLVSP